MTPEAARRLAAILAPHLVAMRAVTAGTPYADRGDDAIRGEMLSASSAPQISPATKIFIAGMLEHIQAWGAGREHEAAACAENGPT